MSAEFSTPGSSIFGVVLRHLFAWPTLATIVALILAEGLLRIAHVAPPPPDTLLQADPFLLWEMAPGVRHEAGVTVHVNSLGLRGDELRVPRPARRFLTLGDSTVYGFGVEDDQVFSTVAARALGPRVEAVNGGVGGYSTFQSIRLVERRGALLEPDLLVIGALWSDNNFDSFVDRELLAEYGVEDYGRVHRVYRLFSRSALFRLLDRALRGERPRKPRQLQWRLGGDSHTGRRRVELNDYARNLETLVEQGRDLGAEVLFLVPANEEDVGPPTGPRAWNPYRQVMRDTAKRHGAPLIDAPTLFRASGHPRRALFQDAMHPTALGHRLMGEAIAALLIERRWPDGGAVMGRAGGGGLPRYQDDFLHIGERRPDAQAPNVPADAPPPVPGAP